MYLTHFLSLVIYFDISGLTKSENNVDPTGILSHISQIELELHSTMVALQATTDDLHTTMAALQATTDDLGATKAKLNKTRTELNANKRELYSTMTALQITTDNLEATKTELNKTKVELQSTTDDLKATSAESKTTRTELQTTKTELHSTMDALNVTKTELQSLKNKFDEDVAFQVSQRASSTGNWTNLKFDTVDYNSGGGYDDMSGVFTAPVSGTYMFWANVDFTNTIGNVEIEIYKGQQKLARGSFKLGNTTDDGVSSTMAVTHLIKGEQVHFITGSIFNFIYGSDYSSYGGALIHAT